MTDAPPFAHLVLAPNAGPMTLEGTNTWVLRAPGSSAVIVVDPGPPDTAHLEAVAAHGEVALVLLTHGHRDHAEGMPRLHEMVGAPVLATDAALCRDADPLQDGQLLDGAGVSVRVVATPGHSADSVSFVVSSGTHTAVLTGDTILGRGTTVIAAPDGRLDQYLATLRTLDALGDLTVLPGHGPVRTDVSRIASEYLMHRLERLEQIRAVVAAGATTVADVLGAVYPDVDPAVRFAAAMSVQAQLDYLAANPG